LEPSISFLEGPGGCAVARARHGAGPPLICPAWWVSHAERDWARPSFRAFFGKLGERLDVVRYDRPGVGLSNVGPALSSLEQELELLERVVDSLGAERISLLGISCGAPPALAFAARHPERVERLALCGAYASGNELAPSAVRTSLLEVVRAHWGLGSRVLADVFVPELSGPELESYAAWQREACSAEAAARLLELTYAMDASAHLPQVRAETLVIHRRQDRAVPYDSGRRLAAAIAGARLVSLEGSAHPPWEGAPDIAEHLLAFLRRAQVSPAPPSAACSLDRDNCELSIEGRRVPLTPLELALLVYLEARPGRVITRPELLRDVWQREHVGSNVVDGVMRTLRKKLGEYRGSIETVTGHGYRFRGWKRAD
jgi:pimeloyl-ACP methyl ester carboxylesterase